MTKRNAFSVVPTILAFKNGVRPKQGENVPWFIAELPDARDRLKVRIDTN